MISFAGINQIDEIFEIEKKSFTRPWSINQIKNDLHLNSYSENWVYLLKEKVIGYIFVYKIENEFHLNNLAVHPDYLRRKIGKSLIQHIITRAKKRKVNVIFLEVSINNFSAIRCYESLGFIKVGLRKNYYSKGDDAILFDLEIN